MKRESKKNKERGITLIEVVVAIAIIVIFSLITISDFPKIKRQFSLSRATYKLAQDLRKTEDLGFSGVQLFNEEGVPYNTKGYGFYINSPLDDDKYLIYADYANGEGVDYRYTFSDDIIVENIDMSESETGIYIKKIYVFDPDIEAEIEVDWVSINFTPPNPEIIIAINGKYIRSGSSKVRFVLSSKADDSMERIVSLNSSGLIEIE